MVVQPASWRLETVPAEYETVTERVLVREAHTEWRRGVLIENRPTAPEATQVLPTGEVLCLIEVPAEYRLVSRQILRTPARTVRVEVPAVTRAVARQVIDCPAHVESRIIPAEYRSVRVPCADPARAPGGLVDARDLPDGHVAAAGQRRPVRMAGHPLRGWPAGDAAPLCRRPAGALQPCAARLQRLPLIPTR